MLLVAAALLAAFVLPASWALPVVVGAAVVEIGEAFIWVRLSQRGRVKMGAETLVGRTAVVVTPCRPLGQVRLEGELWQARCAAGADPGERVRVRLLDGLTLLVEPEP
jgi:membrane-bound serine protease (ClpP class)